MAFFLELYIKGENDPRFVELLDGDGDEVVFCNEVDERGSVVSRHRSFRRSSIRGVRRLNLVQQGQLVPIGGVRRLPRKPVVADGEQVALV